MSRTHSRSCGCGCGCVRHLGMCVAAFFWSHKMHRSVTTNILLPDMFVIRGNIGNCAILTDIVFVRQDANAQLVRFSYNTVLFSCVFFRISAERPEICGRIGNEMRRERKMVTKRCVLLDKKKNNGDASPNRNHSKRCVAHALDPFEVHVGSRSFEHWTEQKS